VSFVKESFSSAEARRALLDKATQRNKKTDTPIDAAAAAIILQKYLDQQVQQKKNVSS
jgi:RNase H-fold protein (predicted Holliday junction resolvase)